MSSRTARLRFLPKLLRPTVPQEGDTRADTQSLLRDGPGSFFSLQGECLPTVSKQGRCYLPTSSKGLQTTKRSRSPLTGFFLAKTHLDTMNNRDTAEREGSTTLT